MVQSAKDKQVGCLQGKERLGVKVNIRNTRYALERIHLSHLIKLHYLDWELLECTDPYLHNIIRSYFTRPR